MKLLQRLKNLFLPEGKISDGFHSFDELYHYRMLYNAAFFNSLEGKYEVHKSYRHADGELCFGGGWFIVMAYLPTGQISNHYRIEDWNLFNIPERWKADEWDGPLGQDAYYCIICTKPDKDFKYKIFGNAYEGSISISKENYER